MALDRLPDCDTSEWFDYPLSQIKSEMAKVFPELEDDENE
jgi:hypothetical protein